MGDSAPVLGAEPLLRDTERPALVLPAPLGGLAPAEAAARLAHHGPNEVPPPASDPWPVRVVRQLRDPMALLLVAAAAVSGLGLGERADAVAILAIVALNAAIAVAQEGRASRALEASGRSRPRSPGWCGGTPWRSPPGRSSPATSSSSPPATGFRPTWP